MPVLPPPAQWVNVPLSWGETICIFRLKEMNANDETQIAWPTELSSWS